MVSGWIRGTSPDSTNTVSKLCKASRASIMACPVPRCSRWSTKLMPVGASASRTRSASKPMMAKTFCGGTTWLAADTTCASSGFPAISCSTLGRRDFSRVPWPAARIAIANFPGSLFAALAEVVSFGIPVSDLRRTLRFPGQHGDRGLTQRHHKVQQVMRNLMRVVAGDQAFLRVLRFQQVLAQDWLHPQRLDSFHVGLDLRLLLLG